MNQKDGFHFLLRILSLRGSGDSLADPPPGSHDPLQGGRVRIFSAGINRGRKLTLASLPAPQSASSNFGKIFRANLFPRAQKLLNRLENGPIFFLQNPTPLRHGAHGNGHAGVIAEPLLVSRKKGPI